MSSKLRVFFLAMTRLLPFVAKERRSYPQHGGGNISANNATRGNDERRDCNSFNRPGFKSRSLRLRVLAFWPLGIA